MIEIRQTRKFQAWLSGLRDRRAQEVIARRIVRLEAGLIGDAKYFRGIGEIRVDCGPGYRLYFCRRGNVLFLLLTGGDKSSQSRDVEHAIAMAEELDRDH